MPDFIGGLELSRLFYIEVVRPLLAAAFPDLIYSAALIGAGSEILGYDTPRSTDHEWGPRLLLFLREADYATTGPCITEALRRQLPPTFHGYSTHFGPPDAEGIQVATAYSDGPVEHKITVHTIRGFFMRQLGLDPSDALQPADWLTLSEQRLLEVTAGAVYHDGLGELESIRARLAYYPRDLWLFLMASQWRRIAQQEAFVGRTGDVGDGLGSRLIAGSIVRNLMRLCFLLERRYTPYSKWFGTAFARLACAPILGPILEQILTASTWQAREAALSQAYGFVAGMHNALGVTPLLDPQVSSYYSRPYLVLHADRFVQALEDAVTDPAVRKLAAPFGAVDQCTDSTDILSDPVVYRKLRLLYE
ncbi:MAG TPA: DUF4037 domain-containing protein [Chloroflexia bacterium]